MRMRKLLIIGIILVLLLIDWFEFHDFFEPKTLPQFLTGLVSIPIIILFVMDLFGKKN